MSGNDPGIAKWTSDLSLGECNVWPGRCRAGFSCRLTDGRGLLVPDML